MLWVLQKKLYHGVILCSRCSVEHFSLWSNYIKVDQNVGTDGTMVVEHFLNFLKMSNSVTILVLTAKDIWAEENMTQWAIPDKYFFRNIDF